MSSSSPVLTDSLSFVGSLLPASLAHTIEKDLGPLFQLAPIDHPTRSLNPNVTTVYSSEFGFERLFESREYVDSISQYMKDKWKLSFVFAAVYLLFVVVGRWFMSSRPKLEIRKPLIVWNILLAGFSIAGSIRVWPEFLHAVFDRGIVYSVCDASYAYSITGFWAFLFCMSKLPELVDTVFIVLRKQVFQRPLTLDTTSPKKAIPTRRSSFSCITITTQPYSSIAGSVTKSTQHRVVGLCA